MKATKLLLCWIDAQIELNNFLNNLANDESKNKL